MSQKQKAKRAFAYVKERAQFFNKSKIELKCGITRTNLGNAINRRQDDFEGSEKLIKFLDEWFEGWDG